MPRVIHIGSSEPEIVFGGVLEHDAFDTTHTITGLDFGAETPDRMIVVGYTTLDLGDRTITVGGVAATKYPSTNDYVVFGVAQPTGSSGSIVFTSAAARKLYAAYWIVYGLSPVAIDVDVSLDLSSPFNNNATVSVVDGGAWFAFAQTSPSASLSGITNDFQVSPYDSWVGGSELTTAAGTKTASVSVLNRIGAVSFGP